MTPVFFSPLRFPVAPVTGVGNPCKSSPGCTSVDVPVGVVVAFILAIVLGGALGAYCGYRQMRRKNSSDSVIVAYTAFMWIVVIMFGLASLALFIPDTLGIVVTAR